MPASPRLPLVKRIPPGLWAALAWFAAAVAPIVEYVVLPSRHEYSLSYPSNGLGSFQARALLVLAAALALAGSALLRRSTMAAYVLVVAATVVSTLAWRQDGIPPIQFLATDFALCYVAATRPRRGSLPAAAGTLGVLAGYLIMRGDVGSAPEAYLALTVVIAWLIGNSVSQARAHTRQLHDQAAAQAVTAERLRIAREMHDTVAHSIGIIALQAGAAVRVAETQPARAREAMRTVEKTGRDTLSGLQHLLGALRETDPAPLRPAAGLADVERLASTTTVSSHVHVQVRWKGTRRPLPTDIDLAAFRIIQESVTNTVRHSGTDSCQVSIDYRAGEIAIEIRDHGNGTGAGDGTGYGLAGMRERVALLHGDLTAGPHPAAGFLVTARLPIPAEAG
ncbi:sensor histidine kinase [Amycolatopsis nigrescens]|uniref:sensor histidine kinase n=1 Tax=Amycolatopsis nigrescens TaxID=381445 RepID=UPI0003801EEF|nr:sensor histidine kinase [Amycolatopsis nigrescens]